MYRLRVLRLRRAATRADLGHLARALRHPDQRTRLAALDIISTMSQQSAMDLLLGAADHEDTAIRSRAAGCMATVDSSRVLTPLRALFEDPSSAVRESAAGALCQYARRQPKAFCADPEAIGCILKLLDQSTRDDVCRAALEVVAYLHLKAAAPLVTVLVKNRSDVRDAAERALIAIGEAAAPQVARLYFATRNARYADDMEINRTTAYVLARICGNILEDLPAASQHKSWARRAVAAIGLTDPDRLAILLQDSRYEVRSCAAESMLAAIEHPRYDLFRYGVDTPRLRSLQEILFNALLDDAPSIVHNAGCSLVCLLKSAHAANRSYRAATPVAGHCLAKALTHSDKARWHALWLLAPDICPCIDDHHMSVISRALVDILTSSDSTERVCACRALMHLKDPSVKDGLVALLDNSEHASLAAEVLDSYLQAILSDAVSVKIEIALGRWRQLAKRDDPDARIGLIRVLLSSPFILSTLEDEDAGELEKAIRHNYGRYANILVRLCTYRREERIVGTDNRGHGLWRYSYDISGSMAALLELTHIDTDIATALLAAISEYRGDASVTTGWSADIKHEGLLSLEEQRDIARAALRSRRSIGYHMLGSTGAWHI